MSLLTQILVALLFACSSVTVWLIAGPYLSRLVDRYQLRPSLVSGALNTGTGLALLLGLVFCHGLYILLASGCLAAAILIAIGVDQIRTSAAEEYRPFWYQGRGSPSWSARPSPSGARQVSVFSAFTFMLVLCIGSAIAARHVRVTAMRQTSHDAAAARILELGGAIHGTVVTLAGTDVRDADLDVIRHFQGLSDLNLGATRITNQGLPHIARMRSLSVLNLSGTRVDDAGLVQIASLARLRVMRLRQTWVTGTAFPLRPRRRWLSIDLSRCPISEEGLRAISRMRCKNLSIGETEVDDSMLDALESLQVQTLDIHDTDLSPAGIEQLRKSRPDLQLVR